MNVSSKKMINFFLLLVVCIIAAFLIKGDNSISEYSEIIGALFFVYGIISAYYLKSVWNTESRIGEEAIKESSAWKMLYLYCKNKLPKIKLKTENIIYDYIKIVYGYEYREFHKSDAKFFQIVEYFLSQKDNETTQAYDYLKTLQEARETQKILYKKSRSTHIYLLLYVLLALCIFSTYLLKANNFIYNIIVGIFTAAMILILQIIVEKRNLSGDEYNTFFRPFDEIIDLIGKKRIYPESSIKCGLIDTKLLEKKKIPYEVMKGK